VGCRDGRQCQDRGGDEECKELLHGNLGAIREKYKAGTKGPREQGSGDKRSENGDQARRTLLHREDFAKKFIDKLIVVC
jgi:hypothetical protein